MSKGVTNFLQGLKLLPGLQVRIVVSSGAAANTGTGGIPYVFTGSLVAETDDRLKLSHPTCPSANVDNGADSNFLLVDLGTAGVTILAPGTSGANPTTITLSGIIALNLNSIQIIAPVNPL
jgi:hypothetical protein